MSADIIWDLGVTLYLEVHYLKSAAGSEVHLSVQVDRDLRYVDGHSSWHLYGYVMYCTMNGRSMD